jgi:hypothetical protein
MLFSNFERNDLGCPILASSFIAAKVRKQPGISSGLSWFILKTESRTIHEIRVPHPRSPTR